MHKMQLRNALQSETLGSRTNHALERAKEFLGRTKVNLSCNMNYVLENNTLLNSQMAIQF